MASARVAYVERDLDQAAVDVAEAAQWYNERQTVGEKFIREVDEAIVRILENPLAFPIILRRDEIRRILTKRFPYRIFFSTEGRMR
jgi:hypothetical protein